MTRTIQISDDILEKRLLAAGISKQHTKQLLRAAHNLYAWHLRYLPGADKPIIYDGKELEVYSVNKKTGKRRKCKDQSLVIGGKVRKITKQYPELHAIRSWGDELCADLVIITRNDMPVYPLARDIYPTGISFFKTSSK